MSRQTSFERAGININLRVQLAFLALAIFFTMVLVRVWYLQIVKGDYFRALSENNRIRVVYVPPERGVIYDRNAEILAKNRPSFNIELVIEDVPDITATLAKLEQILSLESGSLGIKNRYQNKRKPFEARLILRDVSRDMVAKVAARKFELPGVIVGVVPARDYIHGPIAAHVLGYIREITRSQLSSERYSRYLQGEVVGQYGLEDRYEEMLQGIRGLQRVEVNARGTRIGESSFEPERAGNNLFLTLDLDVQRAADQAFENSKGAIVAMHVETGEILALSSSATFDPNIFSSEVSSKVWNDLAYGKDKKLTNRALQGAYPPGSVFKIFMAIAALAEGVVSVKETVFCPGFYRFAGRDYRCHKKSGHGSVDLNAAVAQSCDVYFYLVGQRLGVDRIHTWATQFGLGLPTGLTLGNENAGLVPSSAWKARRFKRKEDQKWYPGETLSVAIGQGAVTSTPIQIARGIAAVVNGGRVLQPWIVKKVVSSDGTVIDEMSKAKVETKVSVDPKILEIVKNTMVSVVADPRGTGHRARLELFPDIKVGGKTGTSQVVSAKYYGQREEFEDHAWFAGFAPADKPEIVVAALVEHGGHGGAAAAPKVKSVMQAYFMKQYQQFGKPMPVSSPVAKPKDEGPVSD